MERAFVFEVAPLVLELLYMDARLVKFYYYTKYENR